MKELKKRQKVKQNKNNNTFVIVGKTYGGYEARSLQGSGSSAVIFTEDIDKYYTVIK